MEAKPWEILGEHGYIILPDGVSVDAQHDHASVLTRAALKKANQPNGKISSWELCKGGVLVVVKEVKVGPRGGVKWLPGGEKVIITKEDKDAARIEIQGEGLCPDCHASGLDFCAWRINVGSTFRKCKSCNGTGTHQGASA